MIVLAQFFLTGVGLGAVNTEALRRGLARGARPALLVQLGALIGDSLWAALALTGTALLVQSHPLRLVLCVVGATFLMRLAWRALQESWSGGLPRAHGLTARGDFATGVVFSVANPFALAFWTGIGGGLVGASGCTARVASVIALFSGFMLGASLWCLCLPIVIGWGQRFVRPVFFRWVNALCGLTLGYFSLRLLWDTLHALVEHPLLGHDIRLWRPDPHGAVSAWRDGHRTCAASRPV